MLSHIAIMNRVIKKNSYAKQIQVLMIKIDWLTRKPTIMWRRIFYSKELKYNKTRE